MFPSHQSSPLSCVSLASLCFLWTHQRRLSIFSVPCYCFEVHPVPQLKVHEIQTYHCYLFGLRNWWEASGVTNELGHSACLAGYMWQNSDGAFRQQNATSTGQLLRKKFLKGNILTRYSKSSRIERFQVCCPARETRFQSKYAPKQGGTRDNTNRRAVLRVWLFSGDN